MSTRKQLAFCWLMYDFGFGVSKDDKEAIKWYRLLAKKKNIQAKNTIHKLSKKFIPITLKTMMNDAENGIAKTQSNLGVMYDFGFGVPEDDKEAVKWYRLAAEQGYRYTELNTIIHDSANMNAPKQFKNWLDKIISAKIGSKKGHHWLR